MPPKNLFKVYGIIFGIALVAVVVTVMIVIGTSGSSTKQLPSNGDLVRVQVRSFPAGELVHLGHQLEGKTPKMLLVPRSDTPIEITVQFGTDTVVKKVVPSDDMVVDFKPHD